jgi:hypothetical protein
MSDEITRLLYDGALAVTEGRKQEAQTLLMRVLELDEENELAWLWLSGAVDDAADQQIALENVLTINPSNQAAAAGLRYLQNQAKSLPISVSDGPWQPPEPIGEDEVFELHCHQCNASVYSVAEYCWQCHSAIHSCMNCKFRLETHCKDLQGLASEVLHKSRNDCPWWRPAA